VSEPIGVGIGIGIGIGIEWRRAWRLGMRSWTSFVQPASALVWSAALSNIRGGYSVREKPAEYRIEVVDTDADSDTDPE